MPVLVPVYAGGLRLLPGLVVASNPTHRIRFSLTRSSRDFALHPLLSTPSEFADVPLRIVAFAVGGEGVWAPCAPLWMMRGPHLHGTCVSSLSRVAVAMGSLFSRGRHFGSRQPRSCSGVFRVNSASKWVATVPTHAVCSPFISLQFLRPPVAIMKGFKLRAWILAQERRTTRAAPSVPGQAPSIGTLLVLSSFEDTS
ncbi:hypothetical protein NDU88_002660 [Pleurodeles waltl]|uniref:Uncharacterized protein n=1 Tax=Pleurodeles waltl TaxID=8319 RepID=A0AAV7MP13_PLEWA|nr:hypothetical protein NDU88_002660 [Pleurodeles waltl]